MFYNHEVLTSKKYGYATIWIVATLGSKSSSKKVKRKEILDLNVPQTCRRIIEPVVDLPPLALRIQGSLLFGVSRVYKDQCEHLRNDAQNLNDQMKNLFKTLKDAALDENAGKIRPEQLMLQDDPSFLPDLNLPLPGLYPQLNLQLTASQNTDTMSLTPFGSQASHSSTIGGLILPSSPSDNNPVAFGPEGILEPSSVRGDADLFADREMLDTDFIFSADGDMIEMPMQTPLAKTTTAPGSMRMEHDVDANARVREDHEEGQRGGNELPIDPMDLDLPLLGDDLSDGSAFTPNDRARAEEDQPVVITSSTTASAPMQRKRRAAHALPMDPITELRNKDLSAWEANYPGTMKKLVQQKNRARIAYEAKKTAEHFVWGGGLGGIMGQMPGMNNTHPLGMFIGDGLYEFVTGKSRNKLAGTKHDRDSGIDDETQTESRRVRQRSEEQPRGEQEDEGFVMPGDDEVELPRESASALDDQDTFSAMPWNISASIRGSSVVPRSGTTGMTNRFERSRPGSRLVSASPLHGKGVAANLEELRDLGSDMDMDFGGADYAPPGMSSDYPEAAVPVETSKRVQEGLSAEGDNFLHFVHDALADKRHAQADLGDTSELDEITFAELLPPMKHSKKHASQGLMLVLALGSKGSFEVIQPEHYGDIYIKPKELPQVQDVVEISSGEEQSEDESDADDADDEDVGDPVDAPQDDSHFEEQISMGVATVYEDDEGSLYGE